MLSGSMKSQIEHLQNNFTGTLKDWKEGVHPGTRNSV